MTDQLPNGTYIFFDYKVFNIEKDKPEYITVFGKIIEETEKTYIYKIRSLYKEGDKYRIPATIKLHQSKFFVCLNQDIMVDENKQYIIYDSQPLVGTKGFPRLSKTHKTNHIFAEFVEKIKKKCDSGYKYYLKTNPLTYMFEDESEDQYYKVHNLISLQTDIGLPINVKYATAIKE